MARALSSQKVFHQLSGIYRMDDYATHAGTTIDTGGGADKGTVDPITVVSASNIASNDFIRVGANGQTCEVQKITVSSLALTPDLPWSRDMAVGEAVQVLEDIDLGATDENGLNIETAMAETPIVAGTQKNTYLYISQAVEEQFSFALRDFEAENLAAALGLDEEDAGIVSANGVVIIPDEFGSKAFSPWKAEGLLEDATPVTALIYSAKVVAPNQTLNLVEGQAAIIAFNMRSNGNRAFLIG